MAALCTGISYGLSQLQGSATSTDGKELIFVKLTDSAYRAIEEFQRNQSKTCSQATIQFLGNEGFISFPSVANSGGQKFSFSLSEIEGPAGSFECIQQSQGQLDVLGTLSNKMRIHANDDVYETTKHRMAVAEENQKNKCTREIKPNQTDIGRRVKLKPSSNRLSNIPSNSSSSSTSSITPYNKRDSFHLNSAASASNSTSVLNSSSNNLTNNHGATSASSPSLKATNGMTTGSRSLGVAAGVNGGTQVFGSGASRVPNRVANRSNQSSSSRGGNPDIMKRSIKERLIHLLALRPYKKPELYARIVSEGVKDRDRNNIKNILTTISYLRDNTYHLNRHIWNDVHEDWPFYTEQDRQNLKRRKPQNLTPPLSSDGGSSTSGQSPTSTHNGSPPPAVKRPAMNSDKFLEGPVSKKTRISRVGNANHDARRGMTDSRDSANMNPRSREHHDDIRSSNSYYGSNSTPTTQESEDSGLSLSYSVLRSDAAQRFLSSSSSSADTEAQHHHRYGEDVNDLRNDAGKLNGSAHDFTSQFRRIESIEQRREYKSIFDKEYAEYRKLHADIDQVSKKFAELEEALRFEEKRLRREERDDLKYRVREIQKRILNEYKETMRNRNHLESKKRFQYLHQKLSHIKKLVNEFDLTLTNGNGILTHSGY
ncbi:RNA polymerase II elongation factor Ell [Lutzomyia longipalpis]|uniref:Putative rna polymerase ii elongation factor ell isoform x1 n=1 Tax=Lutzomyia longipalpis TaxID=7200 RepID=A0A7G3AX21_LUTLO|nr:RNA polymerase II elongation factor Ell [Lutzomyia longipalpis]